MIERNLGNVERLLRLVFGMGLFWWAFQQPALHVVEWLAVIAASCLVLNGVFSRCYLWYVLDINSCPENDPDCRPGSAST